jgi:hypothetical protein
MSVAVKELFTSAGPEDTCLLYFRGGARVVNDSLRLFAADAVGSAELATSLDTRLLHEMSASSGYRRQLLVLDCDDGAAGAGIRFGTIIDPEVCRRSLPDAAGRWLLVSASELEASPLSAEGTSLFTRGLLEGIGSGARPTPTGTVSSPSTRPPPSPPDRSGPGPEESESAELRHRSHC